MRHFFDSIHPFDNPAVPEPRILFIESGSRALSEGSIDGFYQRWPGIPIDLVTCYGGLPEGFVPDTTVFRITDYVTPESRQELFRTLGARGYAMAIAICSAEPIMTKWKWMLALRVPAKFLILNENGDYFWLQRENLDVLRVFVLVRMGLHGAGPCERWRGCCFFPSACCFC